MSLIQILNQRLLFCLLCLLRFIFPLCPSRLFCRPLLFHLLKAAIQKPQHSCETVTETNAGPGLLEDNIVC